MIAPDFNTFKNHYESGKSQLVYDWIPADLETPVSAYLKLAQEEDYAFLLESVEGGATLGRYSAIGLKPDLIWTYDGALENPLKDLRNQVAQSKIDIVDETIPPMGPSGLFGYMGYDMVRLIEEIPDDNADTLGIPESIMIRPTIMVIFDNVKNMICVTAPVRPDETEPAQAYEEAQARLNKALDTLKSPLPQTEIYHQTKLNADQDVRSNMDQAQFHAMVDAAIEYIKAGDIFQVVLGQRFEMDFDLPPFELYRTLRRLNPSPFLFFMQMKDFALVGSSPEIMVRVRDNKVTIRPIAGTRPRGKDAAEDKANAEDLLADPKERAEHLMLLDLGRNDVGRVAEIGSVKVTDRFTVEYYSHVMHIVSNVEGTLRADLDSLDALFAGFPAGTVSGAPKVRAMEIIDELEPVRRSFYAGCIGYLDGNGDVDTCIALRSALVKDGKIYVQASGGIVADSQKEAEYTESVNKAKAITAAASEALQLARSHSDQTP